MLNDTLRARDRHEKALQIERQSASILVRNIIMLCRHIPFALHRVPCPCPPFQPHHQLQESLYPVPEEVRHESFGMPEGWKQSFDEGGVILAIGC